MIEFMFEIKETVYVWIGDFCWKAGCRFICYFVVQVVGETPGRPGRKLRRMPPFHMLGAQLRSVHEECLSSETCSTQMILFCVYFVSR